MLADNFNEIRDRIELAAKKSGRDPGDITLVAVSKYVDPALIREAVDLGQRVFGENYVQEGCSRKDQFGDSAEFHLIGNLQRNKVKKAVGTFELIHTIDRAALADEIAKIAANRGVIQRGLIQVNISDEESKSGVKREELFSLLEHSLNSSSLKIEGLMCIGTWMQGESDSLIRVREFESLRILRDACESEFGVDLPQLSMGMSNDYELAIEYGATMVRVGSALFGDRE